MTTSALNVHVEVVLDANANAVVFVYDRVHVNVDVDVRPCDQSAGRLLAAVLRASSSLWVSSRSSL